MVAPRATIKIWDQFLIVAISSDNFLFLDVSCLQILTLSCKPACATETHSSLLCLFSISLYFFVLITLLSVLLF